MTKTRKRILSLAMAMVMIFTLLPTTAFAAAVSDNNVEIDKTAVRTGEDTRKVTMTVTAKEKEIKPEPLEQIGRAHV